jgi:hypothetical protein
MRTYPAFIGLLFTAVSAFGSERTYTAIRANGPVRIDGSLNDTVWISAETAVDFIQNEPVQGAPVSQKSVVRILYDDNSIYIGAMLYDTAPDSILHQLSDRDNLFSVNADQFRVGFDTYNRRQEGYVFNLSASGVQSESFNEDFSFDAVWESAVQLTDSGWSLEMRIPYSQIRFPSIPEQVWGLQFARLIRRNREYDQWSPVRRDIQNPLLDWGTMTGISGIDPPVRLSLTPYLSFVDENAPVTDNGKLLRYENSYSYSGGADLKLGLNESFTVDMTLLPDFSQVQSDNKIKNLTAFEQIFQEYRPFFKEGVSLFETGGLFYSRRIGRTPSLFYSVSGMTDSTEFIEKNPGTAHLLNATKISGRTDGGLGIGLMNAVTGNTFATVKNTEGASRSLLTEPATDYSVLVLDQQLKNNARIWFVNTATVREGAWRDADVFSGGWQVEDRKHSYRLKGSYGESHVKSPVDTGGYQWKTGRTGSINFDKISGNFQFGTYHEAATRDYDKNDLGYNFFNDYYEANAYCGYNLYRPFLNTFRQGSAGAYIDRTGRLSRNNELTSLSAGMNVFLLDNDNWSYFANLYSSLTEGRDWFEPRVQGRFFKSPVAMGIFTDFSTNYNKPLSFNYGFYANRVPSFQSHSAGGFIEPMVRINDHLSFSVRSDYNSTNNERGYCTFDTAGSPVFGRRDVTTLTNLLTSRYQFSPNMSLALRIRHYWSQGRYDAYYNLAEDGSLTDYPAPTGAQPFNTDFNTNYFNVDMVFNWVFSPGSSLLITYKGQVSAEDSDITGGYAENLRGTLGAPQRDIVVIKALYFLDYERVTHRKR